MDKYVDNSKRRVVVNIKTEIVDQLDYKVVKDNDLIQEATLNLNLVEQKLISYIISLTKPTDAEFKMHEIKASKFAELTGTAVPNVYRTFKSIVDSLDDKAFWFDDGAEKFKFRWLSESSFQKDKGTICVMLNSRITKYLIGLDKNFTAYELYNVLAMKSKYSLRLYELLKSYEYKTSLKLDIEQIKSMLISKSGDDVGMYKRFDRFNQRILAIAVEEINLYTDIKISCEFLDKDAKILDSLKGRKVAFLRFQIAHKEPLECYVSYQQVLKKLKVV